MMAGRWCAGCGAKDGALPDATAARYALYLAPARASLLWTRACAWLGRDAAADADVAPAALPGLDHERASTITADARRYGFHATVKAPFRLARGMTPAALCAAMDTFAQARAPFDLPLRVARLSAFLVLLEAEPVAAVAALHADVLRMFEPFRAPLDPADEARRLAAGLDERQREHLRQWGYPHVLDNFRLHFTLTGPLPREERDGVAGLLADYLAEALAQPMRVDALCLFEEPGPGAPFRIVHRAPFTAS
jgi:putative phosphonate metabolism protein